MYNICTFTPSPNFRFTSTAPDPYIILPVILEALRAGFPRLTASTSAIPPRTKEGVLRKNHWARMRALRSLEVSLSTTTAIAACLGLDGKEEAFRYVSVSVRRLRITCGLFRSRYCRENVADIWGGCGFRSARSSLNRCKISIEICSTYSAHCSYYFPVKGKGKKTSTPDTCQRCYDERTIMILTLLNGIGWFGPRWGLRGTGT